MSVVSSYIYNKMYNQNGDGTNEFLLRGGLPITELFNSETGGGVVSGGALDGKVVPIGLSLISRQPKRNTEYVKPSDNDASVVPDDMFDRLFDAISPPSSSSSKRRSTPSKRKRILIKGSRRKITKKST